jgi:dTDP-4-amino-4,6-dideoxygalactose transaminase
MDVPFFRPTIGAREKAAVTAVLSSGWLTTGRVVQKFEARFAEYLGVRCAVAVNSCTAALHLALEAAGVRAGSIVLVPTMTFAATAEVVRYLSARPVLVDCDPITLCVDPEAMKAAAEQWAGCGRLKAMIPMHYGGQMADMDRLNLIANKYGMVVVEDAAHAFPAYIRKERADWRSVGTTSSLTCFSFYANKCITTGEGGMVTVHDPTMAERIRMMSLHGLSKSAWSRFEAHSSWYYEIIAPGFKYNMTDIAAALGLIQLDRVELFYRKRRRIAEVYTGVLATFADFLDLPVELKGRRSAWHLYPIRLRLENLTIDRARFIQELQARGVHCSVHWMPLHLHPYYCHKYGYRPRDAPIASREWARLVSLPIFPDMKVREIEHVCNSIAAVLNASARTRRRVRVLAAAS